MRTCLREEMKERRGVCEEKRRESREKARRGRGCVQERNTEKSVCEEREKVEWPENDRRASV
jgi:hypothetical protein